MEGEHSPTHVFQAHWPGAYGVSLRVWGATDPIHSPREPGAPSTAVSLGGQTKLEEPCSFTSHPSDRALTARALCRLEPTGP